MQFFAVCKQYFLMAALFNLVLPVFHQFKKYTLSRLFLLLKQGMVGMVARWKPIIRTFVVLLLKRYVSDSLVSKTRETIEVFCSATLELRKKCELHI